MGICQNDGNFLQQINTWKKGLSEIIVSKILENLEVETDKTQINKIVNVSGKLISKLIELFKEKNNSQLSFETSNKEIIKKFLSNKKIFVYIDDLDRGWNGSNASIQRISTLLNAARDLTSCNEGLCIRISLRSDVYFLVRTSDESTDKIEGNVIWYNWT